MSLKFGTGKYAVKIDTCYKELAFHLNDIHGNHSIEIENFLNQEVIHGKRSEKNFSQKKWFSTQPFYERTKE